MASSGSGYDHSSSTFSPDGRIFQVEYASKAVEHAGLMLGIKCADGVVLAVQKPLVQKLLVPTFSQRIYTIASNMGMAVTGFQPDARQLIHRARDEAASFVETYGSSCPPNVLANRLSSYVHYFTLSVFHRPFGAVALVAAYDPIHKSYSLMQVEPSGGSYSYFATAAGKGRQAAKTELEKLNLIDNPSMTCEEGVKQACRIVHMLHDPNKDKAFELEVSWLKDGGKHSGVPKDTIAAAVAWAKEQIEEEEDDDDDEEEDDMEE